MDPNRRQPPHQQGQADQNYNHHQAGESPTYCPLSVDANHAYQLQQPDGELDRPHHPTDVGQNTPHQQFDHGLEHLHHLGGPAQHYQHQPRESAYVNQHHLSGAGFDYSIAPDSDVDWPFLRQHDFNQREFEEQSAAYNYWNPPSTAPAEVWPPREYRAPGDFSTAPPPLELLQDLIAPPAAAPAPAAAEFSATKPKKRVRKRAASPSVEQNGTVGEQVGARQNTVRRIQHLHSLSPS